MTLLFTEGFETYSSFTQMSQTAGNFSWTELITSPSSSGGFSLSTSTFRTTQATPANSKSVALTPGGFQRPRQLTLSSSGPSYSEIIFGTGINIINLSTDRAFIHFDQGSGLGNGVSLYLSASANLIAGTGGFSLSTNFGQSTTTLSTGVWYYLEVRIKVGTTNGEVEVYLDGTQVINATNVNTVNGSLTGYNRIRFGNAVNSPNSGMYLDDIYICDTTGAANNTFLGPISVYTLMPTSNGSTNNFTVTGETDNHLAVDEPVADTTTYVESSTTGHIDYYNFENLPAVPISSIAGVGIKVTAQPDVGIKSLFLKFKNGINILTSAAKSFSQNNWRSQLHIEEKAPDGTDWTSTSVNSTEAGFEVT